jgi:hypothetical protein
VNQIRSRWVWPHRLADQLIDGDAAIIMVTVWRFAPYLW